MERGEGESPEVGTGGESELGEYIDALRKKKRQSKADKISIYLAGHPSESHNAIAKQLSVTHTYVNNIAKKLNDLFPLEFIDERKEELQIGTEKKVTKTESKAKRVLAEEAAAIGTEKVGKREAKLRTINKELEEIIDSTIRGRQQRYVLGNDMTADYDVVASKMNMTVRELIDAAVKHYVLCTVKLQDLVEENKLLRAYMTVIDPILKADEKVRKYFDRIVIFYAIRGEALTVEAIDRIEFMLKRIIDHETQSAVRSWSDAIITEEIRDDRYGLPGSGRRYHECDSRDSPTNGNVNGGHNQETPPSTNLIEEG